MRYTSFIILTTILISCYLQVNGQEPPPSPPPDAVSPPPPPPEAASPPPPPPEAASPPAPPPEAASPPAPPPSGSPPPPVSPPPPSGSPPPPADPAATGTSPPPATGAEPAQQKCPELKALKTDEKNPAYQVTDWVVGRVSQIKDVAAAKIDPNVNTCSVFTHYENCGAIHYTVKDDQTDPKKVFHSNTYAFHIKADNLVHYDETFTNEEVDFDVWSIKLNKMEEIAKDLTIKETTPIPDPVKTAHEKMVASVAVDPAGKWVIHSTCTPDVKSTWVSFSKKELEAAPDPKVYIDSFAADIDKHLADMQLKPEDVPVIETKLGFEPPKAAGGPGAVPDAVTPPPVSTSPPPPEGPPAGPPPPATSPSPPATSPPPPPPPPATSPPPPPPPPSDPPPP